MQNSHIRVRVRIGAANSGQKLLCHEAATKYRGCFAIMNGTSKESKGAIEELLLKDRRRGESGGLYRHVYVPSRNIIPLIRRII